VRIITTVASDNTTIHSRPHQKVRASHDMWLSRYVPRTPSRAKMPTMIATTASVHAVKGARPWST
jgi:hypothetical protein